MSISFEKIKTSNLTVTTFLLAFIYFFIAKLGLSIATLNDNTSPFWPATGFSIACVFLFGPRATVAIFAGAFAVNISVGTQVFPCFLMATGNSLEALLGALILRAIFSRKSDFEYMNEAIGIVTASLLAPLLSSAFGTLGVAIQSEDLSVSKLSNVWITWWTGDVIGGLTLIPLVLALSRIKWSRTAFFKPDVLKGFSLFLLLGVTLWLSFRYPNILGGVFIIFPILFLIQISLGSIGLYAGSLGVSIFAVVLTTQGLGPFTGGTTNDNLLNLQLSLCSLALTALMLDSLHRPAWARLPALVLCAAWLVSGILYVSFQNSEIKKDRAHFEQLTTNLQNSIQTRMNSYIDALYGGVSLFATVKEVSPEMWRTFYLSSKVDQRYPGINGVGIIWPVPAASLNSFLKKQRQRIPQFEIKSVLGHDYHQTGKEYGNNYIITYIEPLDRNFPARGLDVGSEPNRRLAAESSRDTGYPHITPKIILVQDVKPRPGFLLFVPFYKVGGDISSLENRRKNHLGWVYAPFVTEVFFTGISAPELKEISMDVFEGSSPSKGALLFSSTHLQRNQYEKTTTISLAGLQVTIGWSRTTDFHSGRSTLAGWVALIGSVISLLLALIVSVLQSLGLRAQALADEKTFKLSESEQRFRAIVESSMIGTVISDEETRIIDGNTPFLKMLGYKKSNLPSEPFKWSDLTNDKLFLDSFKKTGLAEERHFHGELTLTKKDGTAFPVLVGSAPLLGSGFSTITYVIDLTEIKKTEKELKNSELKFRSVTKSAVDGIVIINEQGSITSWNEGAQKIFAFSRDEVLNTSIFKLIEFTNKDSLISVTRNTFADNIAPLLGKSAEVRAKTKDNKFIPIELTMSSWQIEGEKYYSAILRDITERKKAEQELIRAKEEALAGAKVKASFLANMSHEIRTPLNGILGVADLMFDTDLTPEQKRYAEIIQNSGNNLLNIINDILDFSKIEAGKLQLENISFKLTPLVELQTDLMMAKARSKKLSLSCYIDPLLPSEFMGDPSRLSQILGNLISNAIKFTQTGGVRIIVNAPVDRLKSEDLLWIHFEVLDTGVGMAPEGINKLFQSFTQIDESTSRQFGGTGLGLSISKNLVEMMNGRIGVESQKGVGSKFYFDIPLMISPAAQRRSPIALKGDWKPILVVDNELFSRDVTTAYLSTWGFPYETRPSLEDCLIALKESPAGISPWSMILLACDSQYERLRSFKEDLYEHIDTEIPIVVIADFESPISLAQARSQGFASALRKPIKQDDLLRVLSALTPASEKHEPTLSPQVTPASLAPQATSRKRVLVVDDSSTNRLVIVQLLEKIGYLSFAVSSGEEALQAVELMPFDLILMDVQMPVMDGYEVTRRLRAMDNPTLQKIPIIALTAYAMPGDEAKCLAAGMNDYLAKPVRKTVLAEKLKAWISFDSDKGMRHAPY